MNTWLFHHKQTQPWKWRNRFSFHLCVVVFAIVFVLVSSVLTSQQVLADDNVWTSIGPNGGDVHAIAIVPSEPDTIYVATNGGVFKSINGGDSWAFHHNWRFSTLAVDPVTPTTLFAGSFQSGFFKNASIYKSTDGGKTWIKRDSNLESVLNIAINPNDPQIIYAGRAYSRFV